jgi:hypothetical protein
MSTGRDGFAGKGMGIAAHSNGEAWDLGFLPGVLISPFAVSRYMYHRGSLPWGVPVSIRTEAAAVLPPARQEITGRFCRRFGLDW